MKLEAGLPPRPPHPGECLEQLSQLSVASVVHGAQCCQEHSVGRELLVIFTDQGNISKITGALQVSGTSCSFWFLAVDHHTVAVAVQLVVGCKVPLFNFV